MKPTVAADEMFPEGVGPYMDLEEVSVYLSIINSLASQNCTLNILRETWGVIYY